MRAGRDPAAEIMAGMDEGAGFAGFNALTEDAAMRALLRCCSSSRWADAVATSRPYPSLAALLATSDAAVARLSAEDLREALAGHPRIGDPLKAGGEWSRQEQAGVSSPDASTRRALADGNAEYERRFGHIYLACATGKSAAELLAFLRERLDNDAGTEWRVVASELAKINQIRLRKLVGAEASGGEAPGDEVRGWGLTNRESIGGRAAGGGLASDETGAEA